MWEHLRGFRLLDSNQRKRRQRPLSLPLDETGVDAEGIEPVNGRVRTGCLTFKLRIRLSWAGSESNAHRSE